MPLSRFTRMLKRKEANAPSTPPGMRIYAIGDIHGRLDLLDDLSKRIQADLQSAPGDVVTILLGDYVDRGGDSAGVLDRLSQRDFPTPIRALRGNHEDVMMRFFEDDSVLDDWRKFGGMETLHSYGVDVGDVMRGAGYKLAHKNLLERIPEAHRRFLAETALSATEGDYFFCHAGVRPGEPLNRQNSHDLMWIRHEFLRFEGAWEKVIVHGHTPVGAPEILPNRINIDTGAYATSNLTALVLEGAERRFLSTEAR